MAFLYCYVNCLCLAGTVGFEPTNARTKTWCLTTWPRPTNLCELIRGYYINIHKNHICFTDEP
jgi:hypothetical protein